MGLPLSHFSSPNAELCRREKLGLAIQKQIPPLRSQVGDLRQVDLPLWASPKYEWQSLALPDSHGCCEHLHEL